MSYSRGRFGVEYNATRRDRGEVHLLRWTLIGVTAIAIVSFVSARGCSKNVKLPDFMPTPATPQEPVPAVPPPHAQNVADTPKLPPQKPVRMSEAARLVERWIVASSERPALERTLLEKLLAAERSANPTLALDTIERLRSRPAMADLDEPLARRLGTLNLQLLFSGRPTPWTATVVTRRGDTPYRIAREHGTTVAAILKLNDLRPDVRLSAGTTLRTLEFPRAALVVHRRTKIADLMLNGKFFKRYYASTGPDTKTGSFQVTREVGPRIRFKELSVIFAPDDLEEIAMLLPPGASMVVTDP